MKKKTVFIILCAILISVFSIHATVAFLTDSDETYNVYTVGKVSISLDETDVDELGKPIEGAGRVYDNKYHLMPGYTYVKDPMITVNAGSNDSYVRMLVTINMIDELNKIFDGKFEPKTLVKGWDSEKWLYTNVYDNGDNTSTYEFRYYDVVNGFVNGKEEMKMLEPLFETFMVPGNLTGEQLETIKDLEITIIGQAIQIAGFEDSVDEAWKAFNTQFDK